MSHDLTPEEYAAVKAYFRELMIKALTLRVKLLPKTGVRDVE